MTDLANQGHWHDSCIPGLILPDKLSRIVVLMRKPTISTLLPLVERMEKKLPFEGFLAIPWRMYHTGKECVVCHAGSPDVGHGAQSHRHEENQ